VDTAGATANQRAKTITGRTKRVFMLRDDIRAPGVSRRSPIGDHRHVRALLAATDHVSLELGSQA
jgi:hypothetical protein